MCSVIVLDQDSVTCAEKWDTLPKTAALEMDKGRLVWVGDAPESSEPFV